MGKIELHVSGITCCGCINGVRRALSVLYGVDDVEVDMATGIVTVAIDENRVTFAVLADAIKSAGFEVSDSDAVAA